MNTIWFIKKDLMIGGTELLIERVSREFQKYGYNVCVLCLNVTEDIKNRYLNANIPLKMVEGWDDSKYFAVVEEEDGKQYVITFSLEDFCVIYNLKNDKIKTLLYTVYFDQLIIGGNTSGKFALSCVKQLSAWLLSSMMKRKNIVCMDEHTIHNTIEYYGKKLNINKSQISIIRIPIDIIDLENQSIEFRAKTKNRCKILTISRADFPWKGYILGLIDYVANAELKRNLYLHIVTYGKFEEEIKMKIRNLPVDKRERIELQGKTDYNELEKLYKNTIIYVGQGTTVLDAAQRGILTIPVVPDTYEVISDGFVHENCTRVTVQSNVTNYFDEMIKSVEQMTEEEYYQNAYKSRELVIENYGVNNICVQLLKTLQEIPNNKSKNVYVYLFLKMKKIKKFARYVLKKDK